MPYLDDFICNVVMRSFYGLVLFCCRYAASVRKTEHLLAVFGHTLLAYADPGSAAAECGFKQPDCWKHTIDGAGVASMTRMIAKNGRW